MKKTKRTKKKKFLSSFEKFIGGICVLVTISLIVAIVCSETTLAQVNVEVQKKEKEVDEQKKKIESLEMKIDEMSSLESIKEISAKYGLTYHSENIKTIEK